MLTSKIEQHNLSNGTVCLAIRFNESTALEDVEAIYNAMRKAFPPETVIVTIPEDGQLYEWDLNALKDYVIRLEEIIAERESAEAAD